MKIKLFFQGFYEIKFSTAKFHASKSDIIYNCNVILYEIYENT